MDTKTRFKEHTETDPQNRLDAVEWVRRQETLLGGGTVPEDSLAATDSLLFSIVESPDPEARSVGESVGLETLESGKVIGPAERRVRLLHDLSGRKRIWLARAIAPMRGEDDEMTEEFQAVKIFLPASHPVRETGRDERAQRTDLIGLRAYLARVRARVELATKLDHPNIARIRGWRYGADGWPFAEMEYVNHRNGRSLAQRLRGQHQRGFSWDIVIAWLLPVANALNYAQRTHRIAHQHLDADTVFVTDQNEIKLLGFGLATEPREPRSVLFAGGDPAAGVNAEGSIEPVTAEVAARRDVFALALLVYQLLTGQSVYEAQHQQPSTVLRPEGLTDDAWRVLRRGLAYPSELCPTDAGAFLTALETAQRPGITVAHHRDTLWKRGWAFAAFLSLTVILIIYGLSTRTSTSPSLESPEQTHQASETAPYSDAAQTTGTSGSSSAQAADREADLRAFEAARRVDTLVAYRIYLQRCPRCSYEREVRTAIHRLETADSIREIKTAFEIAVQALEREGRSDRGDVAQSRLDALAALAPDDPFITAGRSRLALGWAALAQASLNKLDLNEARQWLKKAESLQVERPELKALAQRIEQVEAEERIKRQDHDAFVAVQRVHTRKAYWGYLERCAPACLHRAEAEAALARLAPAHPVFRDRMSDGSQGPDMVVIPAGGFLMGSPPQEKGRYNDEPLRPTLIETSFAIGKYEVMFHEYDRFATATGRALPNDQGWGRGRRPVINVSWQDAVSYAEWLSQQTGQRYRLPTEAEWEYAARAGVAASRYWGDDPNQGCAYANAADLDGKQVFVGWTVMQCHDGHIYTAPAGSYRNNDFGLHDMLGNVLEWTCSLYDKEAPTPVQNCQKPVENRQFVVRGGSWNDEPRNMRLADRHRSQPVYQDYFLGFRLARALP